MESFMSVMRITEAALHGMAACKELAFILRLVQARMFVRRTDLMPGCTVEGVTRRRVFAEGDGAATF
jgi:hypothetical protein